MNKHILLIDDDLSLSKIIQNELGKLGYSVSVAADGLSGLELIRETNPDLVILDILLPKMDGYEVLMELRKDNETAHIPVIMLTGLGLEEDIEKGVNLGVEHYLVKPLRTKLLLKCIETSLNQK